MTALPEPFENVTFRNFGGEEDYPGMVAVLNSASAHDGVGRHDTVEEMKHAYAHLTNCDLDTDLLIVAKAGEIVAYRRVMWWIEEATGDRVIFHVGWIRPEARGAVIGKRIIEWAGRRAVDITASMPHRGATHIQTWAEESETHARSDLATCGYRVTEVYAEMVRSLRDPIPDFGLPSGLEIRPVGDQDRRRIWEADQEAFRDHVGFSPGSEADYEEFAGRSTMDPALWKVAFDGDEIAGQVLSYIDAKENEALAANVAGPNGSRPNANGGAKGSPRH